VNRDNREVVLSSFALCACECDQYASSYGPISDLSVLSKLLEVRGSTDGVPYFLE